MRLARVVGNVVSTIKDESYYGYKLMIIEYLDETQKPEGARQIAFDYAQSGIGDVVLVVIDGGACNILMNDKKIIADIAICGVVDRYSYEGEVTTLV